VHAKLIAKLACYGINDMLLYWIQSFLTDRFQYVKIDNSFSALHSVVSGVVQGGVLCPILFVLFVNDICDLASLGVTIKLFADDTKLCYVFDNAMSPDCLQSCLSAISAWSDHWHHLNWHHLNAVSCMSTEILTRTIHTTLEN